MANCNSQDLYESIAHCEGQINMPGINRRVYFVPLSAIIAWPTIDRADTQKDGATAKDIQTYKGDFTLKADTKWRFIDVVREKSTVSFEAQGEEGSKSFVNKAEMKVAGTKEDTLAYAALANNSRQVFLVQRSDNKFAVIGSKFFDGAKVNPSGSLGAAATDENATTLSIEAIDFVALPIYEGKIETEDGTIDATTGEPVIGE